MPLRRWRARTAYAVALALLLIMSTACGMSGDGGGRDRAGSADHGARGGRKVTPTSSPSPTATPTPTPSPDSKPLAWGPTEAEWRSAQQTVAGMTASQKAGQVIVAGFQGTEAPIESLRKYHVGGVIVMGYNVESAAQVGAVNAALHAEARKEGRDWPLLVGVDQEGGLVARVKAPLTEFPAYMTLGAARDPKLARRVARASGEELRKLGFTMVFAPDADVTTGPDDPTIASRSAGDDPEEVAAIVKGSLQGYADAGILSVPKHFPGHGSVPVDSHVSLPVQHASLATLKRRDLVPFAASVKDGASAVMVAHIDVRAVDPGTPASVSKPMIDGILRKQLGFQGAVFTDALEMAAVADKYGSAEAGVRALLAGADVLLLPASAAKTHDAIMAALRSGRLPQARLDEAAARSIALMLHARSTAQKKPSQVEFGGAKDVSYDASLQGLTVVSGKCEGRLVGERISVVGGRAEDRARLTEAARKAGLTVGEGGDVVHLLNRGEAGSGAVVVTLDTPYGLARSSASKARIALYGRTPEAFHALVDVLTGRARGGGRLPVHVGDLPAQHCR
ncbi:glycoside hydrolase family 3 protein [Actinopolymorpha rutila]|uniref:beta-N-acetylhexosaminidase n=1 Tax=Actinopolymorpha rutila TaxID=446787 RepID=A0A852ZIR9_9ACTN|nr:glycoside hydrolase family 3 protein [Actinopolymorpha rutila]NYH91798.1 beta-N-acetylhexosaminidase [Actinopolymorpha rutila]